MNEAVFLSASVPDAKSAPQYAASADAVAIASAVTALVYVTLGRRPLIWGGHPAITPMIWSVSESLGVQYGEWVKLYQSKFFEDRYPEDNSRFRNVTYTQNVDRDRNKSLRYMRERMFKEHQFDAAVFIGGMAGIVEEFDLFIQSQPKANAVPVLSTGGAALELASRLPNLTRDLTDDLDYVSLFHRHLNIPPQEKRYSLPSEQPVKVADRMWK